MRSEHYSSAISAIGLLAGALALAPLESRLADVGGASLVVGQAAAGQGVALAVLGGLRTLAADLLWLRANLAWEDRQSAETEALLRATVAVDPRPDFFWVNGARMQAYDFPRWRQEAEPDAPKAWGERITRDQAGRALAFLSEGLQTGPRAALYLEMAQIHQWALGDLESAARCYKSAARCADAPPHAGRLHAELLVRLGRRAEARSWLAGLAAGEGTLDR